MRRGALFAAVVAALAPAPAAAERLALALSAQEITIASNFSGGDVTLFGVVRPDAEGVAPTGPYDLVAITRGPAETLTVREKTRVAGFWINRASRPFKAAPSFLSALSTRPLDAITGQAARARERLGLTPAPEAGKREAAFVAALARIQARRGLWFEDSSGASFLEGQLFRATIHLPPNVPFGRFEVETFLYLKGVPVARETVAFRVSKAGFEARVAELAETERLGYGAATAALALLFGWAASVIFRRD